MDFGTLLQTAKQNEGQKKEVRTYITKFAPPKKEDKKDKVLSANIQKFLARKETEEKKRTTEANKKRDELLTLRSKDKKATRRVNVMLKRTKSANQSVIDDAVDNDNTAVTLAGPAQPDEDDYGYVSQEASAFYNKMMEKYNKLPEEQKFPDARKKASSNLSSTKDRVRAALEKEKLEAMMPHKRKRKHKEGEEHEGHRDDNEDGGNVSDSSSMPPPKVKPKFKAPPPMNFTELLQLASQKQHEPIMIEVKPKDEGPLFTKKQKQEFEKEQQRRVGDEKGKLSTDQINEIRKLPPSYLYKTKRREISRAELNVDSDDSDDYEKVIEKRSKNTNQISKVENDQNINRKEVPNDRILKKSRDNQVPNRLTKKPNENGAHMSKTYAERTPNDARLSKTYPEKAPSDARLSKTYAERTSNDTRLSKPYSEKTPNDARLSKTHSERTPSDARLSKTYPEKTPNEAKLSKTYSEKASNDSRFSRTPNDSRLSKTPNDVRPSKTYPEKTSNDVRLSKGVSERLTGDSRANERTPSNPNKMSKIQNDSRPSKPFSNKQSNDSRPPPKASSEKSQFDNRVASTYKNSVPNDNRLQPNHMKPLLKPKMQVDASQKLERNYKEPSTSKFQSHNGVPRKSDVNQGKLLDKNNRINNTEVQRKPLPSDDRRPKQLPSKELKPKQFPPPDVIRRKELPPNNSRLKPQLVNKRRIIDDEEEYDSEMDDFIDDGPEESNDYSTYIREIFGYDKRKYRRIDDEDDVDNMESSFAQQMREDVRSTKLGIMEDLEDIKREKDEKRRKALKKRDVSEFK